MPDITTSEIRYLRALHRLETFSERCDRVARVVSDAEAGWAPDDGIATMRDHVVELLVSVRSLNTHLEPDRGHEPVDVTEIGGEDLLRALRGGHERCRRRLERRRGRGEPLTDSFLDALESHGDLLAERCGSIALLRQLIDPERPTTLLGH